MADSLSYSWAEHHDVSEILAFLDQNYSVNSVQVVPGRFNWLFLESPEGCHVSLARAGSHLVAICGHLPIQLQLGNRVYPAAYGLDFMVKSEFRRRGIGREFLRMRLDRFPLSFSTGQSPQMAALYNSIGGQVIAQFCTAHFCTGTPSAATVRTFFREAAAWFAGRIRRPVSGKRQPLTLENAVAWVDQRVIEQQRRTAPGEAAPLLTGDRLRWRFGGPVYRDYRFWEIITTGGSQGLLVSRLTRTGERIVDLFSQPGDRTALLRLAGQTAAGGRARLDVCGTSLAKELKQAGYLVRPHTAQLVALARSPELQKELENHAFFCFAGESDADLLRPPQKSDRSQ